MDPNILTIIAAVVALIAGIIAGKFIFAKDTKKRVDEAGEHAQKIVADAQITSENLKKEKLLEAKEKFVQLKSDHDRDIL